MIEHIFQFSYYCPVSTFTLKPPKTSILTTHQPRKRQNINPVHSPSQKMPKHLSCSHANHQHQSRSLAPGIRPLDLFPRSDIPPFSAHRIFARKSRKSQYCWAFYTLTFPPLTSIPRTQRGRSLENRCQTANLKSYVCGDMPTGFLMFSRYMGTFQRFFGFREHINSNHFIAKPLSIAS